MKQITQKDIDLFRNDVNNFFENIYYSCFDILAADPNFSSHQSQSLSDICPSEQTLLLAEDFILYHEKICLLKHRLLFFSGVIAARDGEVAPSAEYHKQQLLPFFFASPGYLFLQTKLESVKNSLFDLLPQGEMAQLIKYAKKSKYNCPALEDLMFEKGYVFGRCLYEIYRGPSNNLKDITIEEFLERIL